MGVGVGLFGRGVGGFGFCGLAGLGMGRFFVQFGFLFGGYWLGVVFGGLGGAGELGGGCFGGFLAG